MTGEETAELLRLRDEIHRLEVLIVSNMASLNSEDAAMREQLFGLLDQLDAATAAFTDYQRAYLGSR